MAVKRNAGRPRRINIEGAGAANHPWNERMKSRREGITEARPVGAILFEGHAWRDAIEAVGVASNMCLTR